MSYADRPRRAALCSSVVASRTTTHVSSPNTSPNLRSVSGAAAAAAAAAAHASRANGARQAFFARVEALLDELLDELVEKKRADASSASSSRGSTGLFNSSD